MAHPTTSSPEAEFDRQTPSSRLALTLRSAWRTYCGWYMRRAARRHLVSLDDRMLRDIGICRSEIESAVLRGTPRHPGCGAHRDGRVH